MLTVEHFILVKMYSANEANVDSSTQCVSLYRTIDMVEEHSCELVDKDLHDPQSKYVLSVRNVCDLQRSLLFPFFNRKMDNYVLEMQTDLSIKLAFFYIVQGWLSF